MKIAIICSDFQKSNIMKQPWRYVYEIANYLNKKHEVFIITDSGNENINEIKIISVKRLFIPLKGETDELLNILEYENPKKCIMLLGLTSFLRREFRIEKPVIGIFTSPLYSWGELVRNIGIKGSLKYRKYTIIHYLNALIPDLFVKKWANEFESIVFLSNDTKEKLIKKGMPPEKVIMIPVGIDEHFLDLPDIKKVRYIQNQVNPDMVPIIMYFTSPLTLRGTDTLIRAFVKVKTKMNCKLIFLSRIDHKELSEEEEILKEIAREENVLDSIEIISEYTSPEKIKEYLSIADVICLPFKIVISDIPISILEAIAYKPVISTGVACIPEILDGNGLIVHPNDPEELAYSIKNLLDNKSRIIKLGNKSREYIEKYPTWDHIGSKFIEITESDA